MKSMLFIVLIYSIFFGLESPFQEFSQGQLLHRLSHSQQYRRRYRLYHIALQNICQILPVTFKMSNITICNDSDRNIGRIQFICCHIFPGYPCHSSQLTCLKWNFPGGCPVFKISHFLNPERPVVQEQFSFFTISKNINNYLLSGFPVPYRVRLFYEPRDQHHHFQLNDRCADKKHWFIAP